MKIPYYLWRFHVISSPKFTYLINSQAVGQLTVNFCFSTVFSSMKKDKPNKCSICLAFFGSPYWT